MPLRVGTQLGPYEIVARVGAGGMGEVYKARDIRLGRTVAVKVSSRQFTERFHQEAQAIASLNHPNICTLHDVGPDYLVMEYIEGSTLSGPLPVAEALRLAIQIAEALSHAHKCGVVHRDLKPGNILVTKAGAKVLDFGLAKLQEVTHFQPGPQPTLNATLTQEGVVMGTPQYMAPEQLEGEKADRRSDIFAFGLVLYKMITGHDAFEGKTPSGILTAILTATPPSVTMFQPTAPPALEHLIQTCLARDPNDRQQDMHDVLLELKWIAQGGAHSLPVKTGIRRRAKLGWVAGVVSILALTALVFALRNDEPARIYTVRSELSLPPNLSMGRWEMPALSPDGSMLVYSATVPGEPSKLWLRRMDSSETVALAGTEEGYSAFWSPDGRFIAFIRNGAIKREGTLRRVDTHGGPAEVIAELPGFTGSWSRDGVILIGQLDGPLLRVPAAGGEPEPALTLNAQRSERGQLNPHFLPDGRRFLFTSLSNIPGRSGIYVGSLGSNESRALLNDETNATFVLPNYLLFVRGTTLMAQRVDLRNLQLEGRPFPIAEDVGRAFGLPLKTYSASLNGTVAFRLKAGAPLQLNSVDRTGKRLGAIGQPQPYQQFSLSNDEKHVAAQITDARIGSDDLWQLDLATSILSRVTSAPTAEDPALWSPDSRELIFGKLTGPSQGIYRKLIGGGDDQLILTSPESIFPAQMLKDGSLLYHNHDGKMVSILPPDPGAKPRALFVTEYSKDAFRISPDGRRITYCANESGRWEVYIAEFPKFTGRRQVSNNGGVQGHWRKDGKELFYLSLDGKISSVDVVPGPPLQTSVPRILFQTRILVSPTADQYAVTGDGRRFIVLEPAEAEVRPFTLILNWPASLPQ